MKLFKLVFIFIYSLFSFSSYPKNLAWQAVKQFDLRSYSPANYSLKDLVFEIRLSGLTEAVKKRLMDTPIKEIYFKGHWIFPGKFDLEVKGLPGGFLNMKKELKSLAIKRLDFVIPQKLAPKVKGYNLKIISKKNIKVIRGVDPAHQKAVNEIQLEFSSKGKLTKFKTSSPAGAQSSSIEMSTRPWSHNKWVIDSIYSRTIAGIQTTTINYKINYKNIDGFGLPSNIKTRTTQTIMAPSDKAEKQERSTEGTIIFSGYKTNSGLAQKYFRSMNKAK